MFELGTNPKPHAVFHASGFRDVARSHASAWERCVKLLEDAFALLPGERAILTEAILASFGSPSCRDVDALWAREPQKGSMPMSAARCARFLLESFLTTVLADHETIENRTNVEKRRDAKNISNTGR
uniref:Uncharacterized protein n=1 Tax=Candidatus Kentrum sp. LFY TaxID=2126342 RepID=A0A450UYA4_9GAMM|nr:MAG: hypothetical protein BECKLFY1418B_GA0070995_11027 [Candidatus Kentron sp. LFY]